MQLKAVSNRIRNPDSGFGALVVVYAIVFIAAASFIYLIFRDSLLIRRYQAGIDAWSYAESHIYILLIEVVLWILMARASVRLKAYACRIRSSADGKALNYIANAMLLSFVYAILFDMASSFKTLYIHMSSLALMTTVTNLVPLAIFMLVSILLFVGASRLRRLVPHYPGQFQRSRLLTIAGSVAFLLSVIPFAKYFYQTASLLVDDDGLRHFTLRPTMLIGVYLLPFAAVWLLGLLSCLKLVQYARQVKGKIYKPMFHNLATGILIAYVSTFLIQVFYVSNLSSNQFGVGLVFIMSLIVLLIVGYGLMYRGANRLYAIER